jgi:hypothetical protein
MMDHSAEKTIISEEKVAVHDKSGTLNGEIESQPAESLRGNGHDGRAGTQRRLRNYQVSVSTKLSSGGRRNKILRKRLKRTMLLLVVAFEALEARRTHFLTLVQMIGFCGGIGTGLFVSALQICAIRQDGAGAAGRGTETEAHHNPGRYRICICQSWARGPTVGVHHRRFGSLVCDAEYSRACHDLSHRWDISPLGHSIHRS